MLGCGSHHYPLSMMQRALVEYWCTLTDTIQRVETEQRFWGKEVRLGTQVHHLQRKGRNVEQEGDSRVGEGTGSWLGWQYREQVGSEGTALYSRLHSHVKGNMAKCSHVNTTEAVTAITLPLEVDNPSTYLSGFHMLCFRERAVGALSWTGMAGDGRNPGGEQKESLYSSWMYLRKPIVSRVGLVMLLHGIVMYVRTSHNDVMGH